MLSRQLEQRPLEKRRELIGRGREDGRRPGRRGHHGARPPVHRPKAPPTLASGLGAGWHALRVTVSWTLAFLGAITPFAAIAAITGYVIHRGRRWLIRRRPTAQSASGES